MRDPWWLVHFSMAFPSAIHLNVPMAEGGFEGLTTSGKAGCHRRRWPIYAELNVEADFRHNVWFGILIECHIR
ncbi:hypothetical protein F4808DRAFT_419086 [Astrocystis sublimbata]|nr:hypothetical protein F4808DRAFT_419086 [Astrocystis sublimbata]